MNFFIITIGIIGLYLLIYFLFYSIKGSKRSIAIGVSYILIIGSIIHLLQYFVTG